MATKTEALLKSLFAKDSSGKFYIRVVTGTPEGELVNATKTQNSRSLETLLQSAIVLDAHGNPALNLAVVEYGPTYEEVEKQRRIENDRIGKR